MTRTSITHPLEIAAVRPAAHMGLVGLTFAPGKTQAGAMTGAWERDLALDLDAIEAWNAAAVVTLVEEHELHTLQIASLGQAVEERYMAWVHAPIRDYHVPCPKFEATWASVGPGLRARVRDGANVLFHCKGGLGPGRDHCGAAAGRAGDGPWRGDRAGPLGPARGDRDVSLSLIMSWDVRRSTRPARYRPRGRP
jgi:hypothetical protein